MWQRFCLFDSDCICDWGIDDMVAVIKRYRMFLALVLINSMILLLGFDQGFIAFEAAAMNLKEMLLVLPPIFILMGLLDVWVKRETMISGWGTNQG
jgi:hypothetical protein